MANEITYQFQTLLKNGSLQDQYASGQLAATQVSALLIRNVASITIAAGGEALDLGDVATPGFAVFSNLDATNYVEIGTFSGGTFYPFLKLKAGEQVCARLGAAPYAKSNTAPVNLFYIIYSD
jgi:hypothetical protein